MDRAQTAWGQVAELLPEDVRAAAERLPEDVRRRVEEFRLRAGQRPSVTLDGREIFLDCSPVMGEGLHGMLGQASRYSVHAVASQLSAGYLTLRGGHRMGICGQVNLKDGAIHSIRKVTALALRIARPVEGLGGQVVGCMEEGGALRSTLILAPPGAGKTTLLREVVRRISDGVGIIPRRVGLADERCEVSAPWEGVAQLDVGQRTDIMADCPKALAVSVLIRGMSPQLLAMDEITAEEDLDALLWAAGCGTALLATAHGQGVDSLEKRPLYHRLLRCGVFEQAVILRSEQGVRRCRVEKLL